jgi:uncharacterized protein DUF3168
MSDPSLELQAALVGKLKADAGVQAVVGQRVYDRVPNNPTFPYISLGDNQVLPDKADCIDGTEVFWQIDGWERDQTFPMAKQISKAIVAALDDQALTVTGYAAIVVEINTVNYLRDPDGITRHVAVTFRFLIQAA